MAVISNLFMGIIEESISTHRLTGKISELRDYKEIISILRKRKYNIIKEGPSEICFILPQSEYSERYKNKIRGGSILYNHISGDFDFIYPDKYSWSGFLIPVIVSIFFAYNIGWLGFVIPMLIMVGSSRFSFLFYKNVIGREFISDLKLKPDYP